MTSRWPLRIRTGGVGTDAESILLTTPFVHILGAPASSPEGTAIPMFAKVLAMPGRTVTYQWIVTKNGAPYATATTIGLTLTPDDNGTYGVDLYAFASDGAKARDYKVIQVTNVVPTPQIAGLPTSVPAGTPVSVTASANDPSPVDRAAGYAFAWTVTLNGLSYASGAGPSFTFTPTAAGTYSVTLAATDKDGGTGSVTRTLNVTASGLVAADWNAGALVGGSRVAADSSSRWVVLGSESLVHASKSPAAPESGAWVGAAVFDLAYGIDPEDDARVLPDGSTVLDRAFLDSHLEWMR